MTNGQSGPPFLGKFRGVVSDNQDDKGLGRIRAKVQDVFGTQESGWALPALPYAGKNVGLFLIPPVDALVWIEFEQGDSERPIWTGCFWADGEPPLPRADAKAGNKKVLKTDTCTLTLDDTSGTGEITIETKDGNKIKMSSNGIEIDDGKGGTVKLSGPKVSINESALEVT